MEGYTKYIWCGALAYMRSKVGVYVHMGTSVRMIVRVYAVSLREMPIRIHYGITVDDP